MTLNNSTELCLETWKKKRRNTFIVYTLQYFMFGAEISGNAATLWIYVTTIMNTDSPGLFYGLINASVYVPSLIFGPVIARSVDKSRRIKLWFLVGNFLSMIGSIVYLIPNSPYCALTGKFFQGFAIVMRPLMVGEIVRSYHGYELQQKLPFLPAANTLGFAIAPAFFTIFVNTDFWIGNVHITYANVTGLIFLTLDVILQILVFVMVSELSLEYDLKQRDELESLTDQTDEEITTTTVMEVLKKIYKYPDLLFIMIFTYLVSVFDIMLFRIFPIVIIHTLHFYNTIVNVYFVIFAISSLSITFLLIAFKASAKVVFYCGLFSLFALLCIAVSLITLSLGTGNFYVDNIILVWYILSLSVFVLGERVFAQVVCGKLTKSCNQSFVESIRAFIRMFGNVFGGLFSFYAYSYLVSFSEFMIVTTVIIAFTMLLRKNTLMNPTPII